MTLRELHLFAGAGGGILGGLLLGHTPVGAVEFEPYCRDVLRARQADGLLPSFPIYNDVREFEGRAWRGRVDVVCGGFPCQPWSAAGKRKGAADERHLWPEMARIVEEVRPAYVFAENVSLAAFEEPWRDLRRLGYRVPPALCLSAADVGAPHLRKRWWLLAADADGQQYEGSAHAQRRSSASQLPAVADCDGEHAVTVDAKVASASEPVADAASFGRSEGRPWSTGEQGRFDTALGGGEVADASSPRLEVGQGSEGQRAYAAATRAGWWATEPDMGRVAHGVACRVDRLRAIGNGQVPQCAAEAFSILMERLGEEVSA